MQMKLIFTTKISHLASFWKCDFLELGNGLLNNYFRPWLVSLADSKLVYEWGNFLASKCVVEVYDDAMAQYEYKGANLSYKHGKFSSGT